MAPGVVRIRLEGGPLDVASLAGIIWAATGIDVLSQSGACRNRREPGTVRVYLTAALLTGRPS